MRKISKATIVTTTLFMSLVLVTIHLILYINKVNFDINNYYFTGIQTIFIVDCYLISLNIKNYKLILGLSLITLGDIIFSFTLFKSFDSIPQEILLISNYVLLIIGMILLIYYFYQMNDYLLNMAYYNLQTNLPNRNYLFTVGRKEFNYFMSYHKRFALLFIDLDDFKLINDYFGHSVGDEVLALIAKRLKESVGPEDIVIHLSGDEFLIIYHNLDDIESVAKHILAYINEPYIANNREVIVSCSIGISFYPDNGVTLHTLIKKADIAMYEAKKGGKNHYSFFDRTLETAFDVRFNLIHELKNAVKYNEFTVYYQIKANTINNQVTGLEALVRWNHPKHGLVLPNEFVPLAEEIGIISKIDIIVLRKVCAQIKSWIDEGRTPYNISVNISPQFFTSTNFLDTFNSIIDEFNIDCEYLSIEITENMALKNIKQTKFIIDELRKRKVKIHIDDFGKGYSSLTYIKEFAFDYLKIDKTFIDALPHNMFDTEIIKMIINLSNLFGFKIIYEGVENEEQLAYLRSLGSYEYQGYLLSKPQPIEVINKYLDNK
ncbi:MAG: bifunctional diguanylate cyclase/phosphodiesterase [Bacilli bacterium]|nr:bifunctional diguanylate cyclase/phosphodiesterase [Bacilli bacterium]